MEIDIQAFTTCEVAPDGDAISLGFIDATGSPTTIRLSLDQAGALLMTLPGADRHSGAEDLQGSKPALYIPARVMECRTIVRSDPMHRHAADGGRI